DLRIDWGDLRVSDVYPERLPDLFSGRPILITGRFDGRPGVSDIEIRGRVGREAKTLLVPAGIQRSGERHHALRHIWARRKMRALQLAYQAHPTRFRQNEMLRFSIENKVLCRHSAFLATDTVSRIRSRSPAYTVSVPVPIPHGVRYDTTVD
ncbi:MAG: hypothetical protein AAF492_31930, partial [Verrucomicrobiota bacterium]